MRITHIFKGIKLFSVNSKAKNEPRKGKATFYRKTDNSGLGTEEKLYQVFKILFCSQAVYESLYHSVLTLRVIQQTVKRQKRNLSFPFEK